VVILDLRERGAAWRRLTRAVEEARVRLCLPAVVVDEVLAHRVNRFQPEVTRAIELVRGLATRVPPGWAVLPYPAVPHRQVVARALARRRPFDPRGRGGYRDTLIWESVLELARQGGVAHVVLVTRNHKDFAAGDGSGWHADLRADLVGLSARVDLAGELEAFDG
jgi:hypothetical protein